MSDPRDQIDRIEQCLDARIEGSEPPESGDTQMKQAVELQDTIDQSLRRQFAPPDPDQLKPAQTAGRVAMRASPARRLLAAAAILAIIAGGWMIWRSLLPPTGPYDQPWRSVEAVYRDTIDAGFQPRWVCDTEQKFIDTFHDALGMAVVFDLQPENPDASMLGLDYANTLSPRSVVMLARVHGEPVLVFVDRTPAHIAPRLSGPATLHLHRRDLGDLVIYELSPFETPSLLRRFGLPSG